MSYRTTITSDESENEHLNEPVDMRPSYSKTKPISKRVAEKYNFEKAYERNNRESISERLKSEDFDVEVFNSPTFRQGDGVVTIKTPFEEKGKDLWVISLYKVANIENVPVKDRWKFSEATVRLHTRDESKDQTLHIGLNETMQSIFDKLLTDPKSQTIKSKTTV